MAKNDLKLFAGGSSANVMSQADYETLASLINGFSTGVAQSSQLNKVWRQASFVAAMIGLFTSNNSGEDVLDDSDVDGFETKFARAMQAFIAGQTDIGSFWQPVTSLAITTPPVAPTIGDAYVIPDGATGAWAGNSQSIAVWVGSKWRVFPAKNGHGVSLPDGRVFEKIGGIYIEKPALDVQSGKWFYAAAAGTPNALTAALSPVPSSLTAGLSIKIKIASTNTGTATINVNGLGAKAIVRSGGLPLKSGDLPSGAVAELSYDGTNFQLSGLSTSTLPPPPTIVNFNTVGTQNWTVPTGVYVIEVEVWGGGGGGGGSVTGGAANAADYAGEGGGGGGYSQGAFNVTPGQVLAVTVGAGGTAGPGGSNAGDGGTSSLASLLSATGGQGGRVASASTGTPPTFGRQGGSGTGGQVNLVGGWGNVVSKQSTLTYPGGGGTAPLGGQGAITSSTAPSNAGSPGGGGGGSGGTGVIPGSAGAPGRVTIKY